VKIAVFEEIYAQYSPCVSVSTNKAPRRLEEQSKPSPSPVPVSVPTPALAVQPHRARIRAIECHVNGTLLQMVVDTGASHTILYRNQVNGCGLSRRIDTNPAYSVSFTTVQGRKISSLGVIHNVEMIMGTARSSHQCVILDGAGSHGLLGMDWLNANCALIDVGHDCLRIGLSVIPFVDVW
jgi:hypothetical protein